MGTIAIIERAFYLSRRIGRLLGAEWLADHPGKRDGPGKKGGCRQEVDFIVPLRDDTRILVQVCESLAESQTRKRDVTALSEAMAELGLTSGTIVTRNNEERIDIGQDAISVIPIWRFLLDLPEAAE